MLRTSIITPPLLLPPPACVTGSIELLEDFLLFI